VNDNVNVNEQHIALLRYVADQLRSYAVDIETDDGVLPTFADLLDGVADELGSQ
jgi:hypothetical protein